LLCFLAIAFLSKMSLIQMEQYLQDLVLHGFNDDLATGSKRFCNLIFCEFDLSTWPWATSNPNVFIGLVHVLQISLFIYILLLRFETQIEFMTARSALASWRRKPAAIFCQYKLAFFSPVNFFLYGVVVIVNFWQLV
jgi:hypothetical protein